MLAAEGYAVTTHRFEMPGDYVVRVERSNELDVTATGHLHVHVSESVPLPPNPSIPGDAANENNSIR